MCHHMFETDGFSFQVASYVWVNIFVFIFTDLGIRFCIKKHLRFRNERCGWWRCSQAVWGLPVACYRATC